MKKGTRGMADDLFELLKGIRYDATAIQAKVSDALRMLSSMNLPEPGANVCPKCGITVSRPTSMSDHLRVSHDIQTVVSG